MTAQIRLTPAAVSAIRQWQMRTDQPHTRLRLGVQPGGCAGYFYTLGLEPEPQPGATEELVVEQAGVTVVMDPQQYPFLAGLTLDYTEDLVGGSFRFSNPQAHQTCSCGHSFAVAPKSESP
jgi:iron-sulfur cluster assembly accessory protein